MMNFTNDEMNLMCIYQSDSRSGLIAALTEMRGYLDEDEAELRALTDSALQKLGEILMLNQEASAYLMAEFRLNQMLGDVYKILAEAIDVDLGALDQA